jgi:hypothetical protein
MSHRRKEHFSNSLRGLLELLNPSYVTTDCYDLRIRRVETYSQSLSHLHVPMQVREQKHTVLLRLLIWFTFEEGSSQEAPHISFGSLLSAITYLLNIHCIISLEYRAKRIIFRIQHLHHLDLFFLVILLPVLVVLERIQNHLLVVWVFFAQVQLHLNFHQPERLLLITGCTSAFLIGCHYHLAFHQIKHLLIGIDDVLGRRVNQHHPVGYQVQGTAECFSKLKRV